MLEGRLITFYHLTVYTPMSDGSIYDLRVHVKFLLVVRRHSGEFYAALKMMAGVLLLVAVVTFSISSSSVLSDSTPGISSHILDETNGQPAANVWISLYLFEESSQQFQILTTQKTDADGRIDSFVIQPQFVTGKYKLLFNVEPYFQSRSQQYFFPYVEVTFLIQDTKQHYHVPLLLSPFGYSTYRGS